jgi:hypothetical protein
MKKKSFNERGQALILIAVAAIALFAFVGLAIDGSAQFSDRRHAQNAADTASLAGALAKLKGDPDWELVALDRASENGYDDDLVTNSVEVHSPPTSGVYANCSDVHFTCTDYVQVLITSHVNTTFARVIGLNETINHVNAVASTISANSNFNFGGNAIVSLSQEGCGIVAGGTTDVTINGGGMYSNSDSSTCSFKKQSCAGVVDVNNADGTQGTITTVGGYSLNTGCLPSASLSTGAKQISFPPPYQEFAEPAACSTSGGKTNDSTTTYLTPGYFAKIPGTGSTWKNNVVLAPGVYCIGSSLSTNASEVISVSGTFPSTPGVFLYFKPGGYFSINGGAGVNLWGINASSVSGDASLADYQGYLMYVAPDYASGSPVNCKINGHATDHFQGTIYAPYCNMTLNGSGGSTLASQLIGYTVDLSGASGVILTYTSGDNATFPISEQVGLSR